MKKFFQKPMIMVQVVFLISFSLLLIIGDHSQPELSLGSSTLRSTDPVVIQFDRPIERKSLENGFRFTHNGSAVPGTFSWAALSVAFIPDLPLLQGEVYTLSVEGVRDTNNQVQRREFSYTLMLPKASFLYLTPEKQLARGNVDGERVVLSSDGVEVISYAVDNEGKYVLISGNKISTKQYQLEKVILETGTRTLLSASRDYYYQKIVLCGPSNDLIAYKKQIDDKQVITSGSLVVAPSNDFTRLASLEQELLGATEIGTSDVLACSFRSRQVLYRAKDGGIALGDYKEDIRGSSIGIYQQVFGFTPDGENILLGINATTDYPITRNLIAIDQKAQRSTLSNELYDATDGAMSLAQLLAYSEDRRELTEGDFQTRLRVIVRQQRQGVSEQTILQDDAGAVSDERPRWSVDGTYVSFERISLAADKLSGNRPQDSSGRIIDGEIIVQKLNDRTNAIFAPQLQNTGLKGGDITWLP